MYLQHFSKIGYFCLNHNKQERLFMSHAPSVYDLYIPAGRKTEIWAPFPSDVDFKLYIITVTAANWHPEVQYCRTTIKQLCLLVSLNCSYGHKEKAFKWLLSTSGWIKMKTFNIYFPISWYQCWCPPSSFMTTQMLADRALRLEFCITVMLMLWQFEEETSAETFLHLWAATALLSQCQQRKTAAFLINRGTVGEAPAAADCIRGNLRAHKGLSCDWTVILQREPGS